MYTGLYINVSKIRREQTGAGLRARVCGRVGGVTPRLSPHQRQQHHLLPPSSVLPPCPLPSPFPAQPPFGDQVSGPLPNSRGTLGTLFSPFAGRKGSSEPGSGRRTWRPCL